MDHCLYRDLPLDDHRVCMAGKQASELAILFLPPRKLPEVLLALSIIVQACFISGAVVIQLPSPLPSRPRESWLGAQAAGEPPSAVRNRNSRS